MNAKQEFYINLHKKLDNKPLSIRKNIIESIMNDVGDLLDPVDPDEDYDLIEMSDEELKDFSFQKEAEKSWKEREERIKQWQQHYIKTGLVREQDNNTVTKENKEQRLFGRTLAHEFAACGNLDKLKNAISEGADLNAKDNNGMTALEVAQLEEHDNIVEYLMSITENQKESPDNS